MKAAHMAGAWAAYRKSGYLARFSRDVGFHELVREKFDRQLVSEVKRMARSPLPWLDDTFALADRDDLVCLNLRESFDLLRGGPFHFNQINSLPLPQSEVKA